VSYESHKDPDDVACEKHFLETHARGPDGKFIVRLPFLPDATPIGINKEVAAKSLHRLTRRLDRNTERLLIRISISLGHMTRSSNKVNYVLPFEHRRYLIRSMVLPHHAVIKEDSSTTKLRVVFNGNHHETINFGICR